MANKTYSAKPLEVERKWYVIDAEGEVLGRLAARVANILRGKNKPEYTPNVDTGDFVIVINAEKVVVSGNKETDKIYYHHTGFPGGLKSASVKLLVCPLVLILTILLLIILPNLRTPLEVFSIVSSKSINSFDFSLAFSSSP